MLDEHTCQCNGLEPRHSYCAQDVINKLDQLIKAHGAPEYIRSHNRPEFIAYAIKDWMEARDIKTHYMALGSACEQPFVESFHDKLRDEFLYRALFIVSKKLALWWKTGVITITLDEYIALSITSPPMSSPPVS